MKDIRDRVTTYKRRLGTGVLILFVLLMSAALSWADTTIYIYQAADGALTVKTFDSDGNLSGTIPQTPNAIPKSCYLPELFWDSGAGALRINGFDSSGVPVWTGTIGADGKFAASRPFTSPTCSSVTPDTLSAVYPDSIPCVSYNTWTTCSNGFMTRTGIPAGCVGQLLSIPCSTAPPCQWTYGGWTPATCAAGSIQTRTATASPSGCIGFPGDLTIQACPPQACTSYNYTLGTCQPNNTAPVISYTGVPAGCTGGATPATTQPCTYGAPACTSWTYTAWSPADGSCTPGSTQNRQVLTSSPAGCTGQPSSSQLSKTCSGSTNGLQGTKLLFNVNTQHYPLGPGEAKLFNITVPACTTTSKQFRVTLGGQQSLPRSDVIVKKVNGNPSRVPTIDDYNAFYALTGRGSGPYMDCGPNKGDGTCDSTGSFFWKFNGDGSGESVIIYSLYNNFTLGSPISLKTSIPNFNQGDDYYLYVINTSATASTDVYVRGYCY